MCSQGPQNHEQPGSQGFLEVVISWPDLWPVRAELLEEDPDIWVFTSFLGHVGYTQV